MTGISGMVTPRMQLYAAVHFMLLTEGYRYMATNYEVLRTWVNIGEDEPFKLLCLLNYCRHLIQ